ncbi:hypothetical protein RCO48_13580 [Peribacillus frigoritolerans]|nr:hypothetical protein [Peribacillus frigoritolerans]
MNRIFPTRKKKIDSLQDKQMTAEDQIAAIEAKIAESAKKNRC